jgi:peptide/nickel transport system substrate-binding protein
MIRRLLISTLVATACWAGSANAGKDDNTLNVAFTNEIATLDNYQESGREGLILARLLYDNLVSKNLETGEFEPELAESYKLISDDVIEFKIRQGVKFHNGEMLTAEDVAYTLNLVSSPEYNARYQIAVEWIDSVEKVDENTVRLKMTHPYPLSLEMLAGNLPIYPKAYYEEVGPSGMATKPIGSGPYKLVEQTRGVRFVLEKFEDYFEGSPKGMPSIDRIVVRILPEANTQYAELLNGSLDWIWRVPPDDAANLERQPSLEVKSAEIMRFAYMSFNPQFNGGDTPIADARVRRAINHAINRTAIKDALVGGASQVINSACNPIQFGCATDVTEYEYDPDKARALLAEAGYESGFTMDLMIAGLPTVQAEAIAADLARVGITLNLNAQQYGSAVTTWRENRAPLFLLNWGSYGVGDVGLSTSQFFGGTGDDVVKNPELIKILQEADTSMDRDRRAELYADALEIIADEAYWVPLWTYSVFTAQNADLELSLQPDEFVQFYSASWK